MSERNHLCAVGLALLTAKSTLLCICYCFFLEAMGYGPRSHVILQEVDTAVIGIRVFLLAFVYGTTASLQAIQKTDIAQMTTACLVTLELMYGEAAITASLTASSFLRGKLHLDLGLVGVHLYRSLCFRLWSGKEGGMCLAFLHLLG